MQQSLRVLHEEIRAVMADSSSIGTRRRAKAIQIDRLLTDLRDYGDNDPTLEGRTITALGVIAALSQA
jgi:putative N-acetylmannosamine-6-phosphate epimerase